MMKATLFATLLIATPAVASDIAVNNAAVQHLAMEGTITRFGASGLTAAGTTLATALALTAQDNFVGTVASGTGVALPNAPIYTPIVVCDEGANTLAVYPSSASDQIGAGSAGTAATLASGVCGSFERDVANHWYRVQ